MLEKKTILDQIEVKASGVIFIRELNQILDNGVVISSIPHRSSVCPLDDVSSNPYQMVKDAASAHWTQEVKDAYVKFIEANSKPIGG